MNPPRNSHDIAASVLRTPNRAGFMATGLTGVQDPLGRAYIAVAQNYALGAATAAAALRPAGMTREITLDFQLEAQLTEYTRLRNAIINARRSF